MALVDLAGKDSEPSAATVAIQKVRIADGINQFVTAADGYVPNGNSVVFVNDSDILVYDTFTRPSTAQSLLEEIRQITDKPVRYVVNSHWHPDHWSGNEVFARAFPELEIIATEETRRLMLNVANAWPTFFAEQLLRLEATLEKQKQTAAASDAAAPTAEQLSKDEKEIRERAGFVAEARIVQRTYPTLTFTDELTLRPRGREFQLTSMVGDAYGSTVLYAPRDRILVTGDLLVSPVPYFTPLEQHAESLRKLDAVDAAVIVPGHGPAFHDKNYLRLERALLESVLGQVRQAHERGIVTIEEIRKTVDLESFRSKFTRDEAELEEEWRMSMDVMIEFASVQSRGGAKFQY